MYHCVMTIQSMWNREPNAAVTHTATLDPATLSAPTAEALYEKMRSETISQWRRSNPSISAGVMVVLHWSFTPNTLTSALGATG